MVRVGNDIVDLNSPFVKEKRSDERFIKRILTETEQRLIARPDFPEHMLWVLWAAKETAYKAVSKSLPGISSAPKRYAVSIRSEEKGGWFQGIVKTPDQWVPVWIYRDRDVVHCIGGIGLVNQKNGLIHGMEKMDAAFEPNYYQSTDHVSNYVRRIAIKAIAGHVSRNAEDIVISKTTCSEGRAYPVVRIHHQNRPMDISFSHDGGYVGYAFYYEKEIEK